jgi:hypothetical protein
VDWFRVNQNKEAAERRAAYLRQKIWDVQDAHSIDHVLAVLDSVVEARNEDKETRRLWGRDQRKVDRDMYVRSILATEKRRIARDIHRLTLEIDRVYKWIGEVVEALNADTIPRNVRESCTNLSRVSKQQAIKALRFALSVAREEWKALKRELTEKSEIDREMIRGKLWAAFDRTPMSKRPLYANPRVEACKEWWKEFTPREFHSDGRKIEDGFSIKPSIWDTERSKEFRNLNMTVRQWSRFYSAVWKKIGCIIEYAAVHAKTEENIVRARSMLAAWQWKLDQQKVKDIADILYRREKEVHLGERYGKKIAW